MKKLFSITSHLQTHYHFNLDFQKSGFYVSSNKFSKTVEYLGNFAHWRPVPFTNMV